LMKLVSAETYRAIMGAEVGSMALSSRSLIGKGGGGGGGGGGGRGWGRGGGGGGGGGGNPGPDGTDVRGVQSRNILSEERRSVIRYFFCTRGRSSHHVPQSDRASGRVFPQNRISIEFMPEPKPRFEKCPTSYGIPCMSSTGGVPSYTTFGIKRYVRTATAGCLPIDSLIAPRKQMHPHCQLDAGTLSSPTSYDQL